MAAIPSDQVVQAPTDPSHPGSPAFWWKEIIEELYDLGIEPTPAGTQIREKQCAWLAAFVRHAGPTLACGIAGTTTSTVKRWRTEDPIFQRCLVEAEEARSDVLIFEARRRAVDGVAVTKYDRLGNVIGEERQYDTRLLIKLIEGLDPHKRFWRNPTNGDGISDGTWRQALAKLMDRDPDALALLDELADKMVGEGQPAPAESSESA